MAATDLDASARRLHPVRLLASLRSPQCSNKWVQRNQSTVQNAIDVLDRQRVNVAIAVVRLRHKCCDRTMGRACPNSQSNTCANRVTHTANPKSDGTANTNTKANCGTNFDGQRSLLESSLSSELSRQLRDLLVYTHILRSIWHTADWDLFMQPRQYEYRQYQRRQQRDRICIATNGWAIPGGG